MRNNLTRVMAGRTVYSARGQKYLKAGTGHTMQSDVCFNHTIWLTDWLVDKLNEWTRERNKLLNEWGESDGKYWTKERMNEWVVNHTDLIALWGRWTRSVTLTRFAALTTGQLPVVWLTGATVNAGDMWQTLTLTSDRVTGPNSRAMCPKNVTHAFWSTKNDIQSQPSKIANLA